MTRDDLHTPTPEAAAAHAANHGHHTPNTPHARAHEAGVTAADVPTGDGGDAYGWWADFLVARAEFGGAA